MTFDDEDDWEAMEPDLNNDQPWPEFDPLDEDDEPEPERGDFWIDRDEDEEV
ncbi:MAG: hypothetical protein ACYC35_02705 [Pirellulales bacterium]